MLTRLCSRYFVCFNLVHPGTQWSKFCYHPCLQIEKPQFSKFSKVEQLISYDVISVWTELNQILTQSVIPVCEPTPLRQSDVGVPIMYQTLHSTSEAGMKKTSLPLGNSLTDTAYRGPMGLGVKPGSEGHSSSWHWPLI